ncbi:substrate-binding domain-containing protein [Actinoallomurus soli]|uniref:substrate-binding domain-containing protein n=1 Tax=Actinoallomurus soli TaxID=2952535 RepID=UPI002093EF0F|nr:substrate-binding domain-containing protein [Actinoallomurus soli]MCO5969083.1 substrate-binding domain-containing protein [Actinoallomurus soli]
MDRRPRRWAALVAAAAALVLGVSACSSGTPGGGSSGSGGSVKGKSLRVGAVFLDSQGFYGGVKAGFKSAASASGAKLKLIESNPGDDASKEASFVSTLVSSRVDALIISASSQTGSVPAIRSAAKAGIPVICYNTCIDQADLGKYVSAYVQGDPVAFGRNTGEAAARYFLKAGITHPKIAVVNCEFVQVCTQRRQGFEEALKAKVPGYQLVSNQAGTTEDKSVSVATNQMQAHPDLDAFYGESGGATYGAYKAIQSANKAGKVVVFGSDMTTDIAKALADGKVIKSITDISGKVTGKLAWEQVQRVLQGDKSLGKTVDDPITGYTADDKPAVQQWLTAHADGLP